MYLNVPLCPGPCPHSGLQATLDCDTNTAVMSWTPGSGILYYNASASVLAFNAVAPLTCSTNGSSCNISSLTCGQSYRLRVSGQGLNCPSPAQDWLQIITGDFLCFVEFGCQLLSRFVLKRYIDFFEPTILLFVPTKIFNSSKYFNLFK